MAVGWGHELVAGRGEPLLFETSVPHFARVYDYWLGGKDNFAADRAAGDQAIRAFPDVAVSARANRAFLARAVRFLAGEAKIRQFLDIGTGIPTGNNTHEVAQFVAPESRVVYVDNDPLVLSHARALLASRPEGVTEYVEADLRDPQRIVDIAARLLDFEHPIAVMLMTILQHIDDEDDPAKIVAALMAAVPPGSYLAISHPAKDIDAESMAKMAERLNRILPESITLRTNAEVTTFFDGLDLVQPGMVQASRWRPVNETEASGPAAIWAGVARKR
jgi:SAM-dependent methyltransferase